VARRAERLDALAADLRATHGITATPIALDLTQPGAAETLFARTEGAGIPIDVLVNNAGFGTQGWFPRIEWSKTAEQLQLNIVSLTELTWRFVHAMRDRGRGRILNVASIGAYLPTPGYATYAAGKAYVRNFSEALDFELRGTGVHVCCLCPGPTNTEFTAVAGHKISALERRAFMSADRCARIGLRALFAGRRLIVSGWLPSLVMWLTRFAPRRLVTRITAVFMQGPRET